jgi:hypothetical protein
VRSIPSLSLLAGRDGTEDTARRASPYASSPQHVSNLIKTSQPQRHGYLGAAFIVELAEATDLLMVMPEDAGPRRALISTIREKVETVFSQLWARFIDRIHSRSWLGLWNTVKLRLLHFNLVTAGLLTA